MVFKVVLNLANVAFCVDDLVEPYKDVHFRVDEKNCLLDYEMHVVATILISDYGMHYAGRHNTWLTHIIALCNFPHH